MQNEHVRLEPLALHHAADLIDAAEEDLFQFFIGSNPCLVGMDAYLQEVINRPNTLPFAVFDPAVGKAVGVTTLLDIVPNDRRLEIGSTWLGKATQGTKINPAAKLLLLEHAFETLNSVRVQLKTDERNLQSRRAIEKLGATYEGTLRNYGILADGYIRNACFFSILQTEWPDVRHRLQNRLSETVL